MPNIIQESIERYEEMLTKSGVLKGSFQHDNLHIPGVDLIKDVYQAASENAVAKRFPASAVTYKDQVQYDLVLLGIFLQALDFQVGNALNLKANFHREEKQIFTNGLQSITNLRNMVKRKFDKAKQGTYLDEMGAMLWEQGNIMTQAACPPLMHQVCLAFNAGLVQAEGASKPMNEIKLAELEAHKSPQELENEALKAENAKMAALLSSFSEETEKINKNSLKELRTQAEEVLNVA